MTQSLSFIVADRPPAMYRIEAVAIVVSRISMNVGITTAVATSQGLTARRLTAFTLRAAALMQGLLRGRREWGPPAARRPRRRPPRDFAGAGRAVARRR